MIAPKQVVLTKTGLLGRLFIICKLTIVAVLIISCNSQKKEAFQVLIHQADSLIHGSRAKVKNFKELDQNFVKASGLLKKAWLIDSNKYVVIQYQVLTYIYMRKADSVIISYSKWLNNYPDQLEPLLKRGLTYHKLNEEAKAKADFVKSR